MMGHHCVLDMTASVQPAGVAGKFYPANPAELAVGVDASLAKAAPPPLTPKAVIAPHAGHIYSGDIAGAAYSLLAKRKGEIKRVVLLGPNHRMPVKAWPFRRPMRGTRHFGPLGVD